MPVKRRLWATLVAAACLTPHMCFAPSKPSRMALCALQEKITPGEHVGAEVAGVYYSGLDMGPLEDAACPMQATWVELALASNVNKEKLRKTLDHAGRAYVVFQGEFYGPGTPDPRLPEILKENYHPGWGPNGFKTKLVVHHIVSVGAAPSRGWLVGSAGFFGREFLGNAAKVTLVVACSDKSTNVQSDENGDYAIELAPCKYRLVRVATADGKELAIGRQNVREFVVRDRGTTRFDVMLNR
jgi:hypothetical protein